MREWQACKVLLDNSGLGRWYDSVILYYICGDFVKAVHNGRCPAPIQLQAESSTISPLISMC